MPNPIKEIVARIITNSSLSFFKLLELLMGMFNLRLKVIYTSTDTYLHSL